MWNTYGPTEATVVASAARLDGHSPVSIGRPLPGWDLAVVDAEGTPVPIGGVGELVIGGVGLARYLDPEKDAEKYAPMASLGWARAYRSGDLVRLEPDGLYFQGRADDQDGMRAQARRLMVDLALPANQGTQGSGEQHTQGWSAASVPHRPLEKAVQEHGRSPAALVAA